MMKALWFVPVAPLAVVERFGATGKRSGSWIQTLEDAVKRSGQLDLGVVCEWGQDFYFEHDGVAYFGVTGGAASPAYRRFLRNWGLGAGDSRRSLDRCVALVDRFGPDVIHVHGTERYFGLLAGLAQVPVVVSLQGVLTVCARQYRRGVTVHPLDWLDPLEYVKGHGLAHGESHMKRRVGRERSIMTQADLLLGRTAWDREVASILSPSTPYRECGELLRPEFGGVVWRGPSDELTAYTTTGGAPYKGLETLVEAIGLLADSGRRVNLRVGGDVLGTQMGKASIRLSRRLGISHAVSFCGGLSTEAIAREIQTCSVYVCASHAENSPNSLAEAMMVGAPCVVSAVGGVLSMVTDGQTGFLVPDSDPWALAGAIGRLADDHELARRLGREARELAMSRHSEQTVMAQLLAAYHCVRQGSLG